MVNEQLKNHLKNFTVKELKKEVIAVKKDFQVSKLRRADIEKVILKNHQHFLHLLKKNKVKKAKPLTKVKKAKPMSKQENAKPNKSQYEAFIRVKEYITGLLDELDEKAEGTRNSVFVDDRFSGVTIQKIKSQYVIRDSNDFSNIILRATTDRKKVEDLLYHMLA